MDQPAKSDLRLVEKILAPKVLRAFDRHAASHRPDHRHLSFRNFANSAERNHGLKPRFLERFEKLKLALIDVEQRVAVRARDSFGFVRRAEFEWAGAIGTTELRRA